MNTHRLVLPVMTTLLAIGLRAAELPHRYDHEQLRYTISWPDGWRSELPEDARYGVQYLSKVDATGFGVQLLYLSTPRIDEEKLKAVASSLAERNPATQTQTAEQVLELTGGTGLQREYTGVSGEAPSRSLARYISTIDGLFILIGTMPASGNDAEWQEIVTIVGSFAHAGLGGVGAPQYAAPAGPAAAPDEQSGPAASGADLISTITIPEGWTDETLDAENSTRLRLKGEAGSGLFVELGRVPMAPLSGEQLEQMTVVLSIGNPLLSQLIRSGELAVHEGAGVAAAFSGLSGETPYRVLMHLVSRADGLYVVIGAAPDSVAEADWDQVVGTVRSFRPPAVAED